MDDDAEILAEMRASPGRRVIGIGSLGGLGVLVLWIAFARPPELMWQVFLIVVGLAALWCADAMRRATASRVHLTRAELRDTDGTLLARVADIEAVDRGAFAFKPSNGFLVRLAERGPSNAWRPGLWWRLGRQIGVGGMTPGHQAKNMADILAALLETRTDRDGPARHDPLD